MSKLPTSFAYIIQTAINRLFKLDPAIGDELLKLNGKIIALEFTELGVVLSFKISATQVIVLDNDEGEYDTKISATSVAFLQLALSQSASEHFFSGAVKIQGDVEAGQQFRTILQKLEIDWEEVLSHYTGDIVAHQLGNTVKSVQGWGAQALDTLRANLGEYLKEEIQILPTQFEAQYFIQQVDQLRQASDRLALRVQRLIDNLKK